MAKTVSGKQCVKILCRDFGFFLIGQRGSHVKLRRAYENKMITTIVPLHRELASGTLHGVLMLANIREEDFRKFL